MKFILLNNYKSLLFIIFLMILTAFFNIISVLGLMPIVDYVTDPSLNSDNRITLELVKIYENYRIEPGLITFGLFYLFTVILKTSIFVFEKFITVKTIVRIMRELIFDQYKSYLDASWEFLEQKIMELYQILLQKKLKRL